MPKKKATRRSAEAFYVDPPWVRQQIDRLEAAFEAGEMDADELVSRLQALSRSYVEPNLPPEATTAQPGTKEKEAVMTARFLAGYSVFHPDDPTIGPSGPVVEKETDHERRRQANDHDSPGTHPH